jgi:hypothetical protein
VGLKPAFRAIAQAPMHRESLAPKGGHAALAAHAGSAGIRR